MNSLENETLHCAYFLASSPCGSGVDQEKCRQKKVSELVESPAKCRRAKSFKPAFASFGTLQLVAASSYTAAAATFGDFQMIDSYPYQELDGPC